MYPPPAIYFLEEPSPLKDCLKRKQILSKLKLDNLQQKVGALSGGQRKRLALAIILITQLLIWKKK